MNLNFCTFLDNVNIFFVKHSFKNFKWEWPNF